MKKLNFKRTCEIAKVGIEVRNASHEKAKGVISFTFVDTTVDEVFDFYTEKFAGKRPPNFSKNALKTPRPKCRITVYEAVSNPKKGGLRVKKNVKTKTIYTHFEVVKRYFEKKLR